MSNQRSSSRTCRSTTSALTLLPAAFNSHVPAAIVSALLVGGRLPPHGASAMPAAHDAGQQVRSPLGCLPLPAFSELGLHILLADPEGPLRLRLGDQGG